MDYFPLQVLQLAREVPEMTEFAAMLTLGRWDASFMPRVNGFVVDANDVQLQVDGFESHQPGL